MKSTLRFSPLVVLVLTIHLLVTENINAQPFQKTFGDSLINDRCFFKQLPNGDLLLVGTTEASGDQDIWISKIDNSFNTIWSKKYRYDYTIESGRDIINYNGGYMVAGTRNGTHTASSLKLDVYGNLLQYQSMGASEDRMFGLYESFDNEIIYYGFLQGWASSGLNRPTIMVLDQALNIQLKRTWSLTNGTSPETISMEGYCRYLSQFSDSSFVMMVSGGLNSGGACWRFLFTDKNFNLNSVTGLTTPSSYDVLSNGCINSDNTFMACGYTDNYGAVQEDFLVGKFTQNGTPIWIKRYGGASSESANAIVPDGNGGHYISGYTIASGSSTADAVILHIDSMGDIIWAKSYGGNGDDRFSKISTLNGDVIASGYTSSFSPNNTTDGWIVMIDSNGTLGDSCSSDISSLFTANVVNTTTVTRMYDNYTFNDPNTGNADATNYSITEDLPCNSCNPPQFYLPNDTLICAYDSVTIFNPNSSLSAIWFNGDTLDQVTVPAETTVWLALSNAPNCIATDTMHISSKTIDVSLGNDSVICQTDSFTLSVPYENNSSYSWSTGSDTNLTTITQSGTYSITATDSIGCYASDSINLILSYIHTPLVHDTMVCQGSSYTLSAPDNLGYHYQWPNGSSSNSTTLNTTGIVLLTITDTSGCSATDTIMITYDSLLTFNLGNDTTLCEGQSIQWDFSSYTGYTFIWNNTITADLYQTDDEGITTLIARKDSSVCVSSDSIEILIEDTLATRTFGDTLLCREELDVFQEYISTLPHYLTNSYSDSIATSQSTQGVFYFSFSNQCDVDTYKMTANLEYCYCEPIIPNVFTPNRDYINDGFTILLTCYPYDYELWIFNRWGKQLFYSDQYGVSWSGTLEGEECPDGVYFYIVNYKTSANGSLKTAKGTVTLLR